MAQQRQVHDYIRQTQGYPEHEEPVEDMPKMIRGRENYPAKYEGDYENFEILSHWLVPVGSWFIIIVNALIAFPVVRDMYSVKYDAWSHYFLVLGFCLSLFFVAFIFKFREYRRNEQRSSDSNNSTIPAND